MFVTETETPFAFRAARKLAATLFEGGVDGAAWNEAAQDVAFGENAEDLVFELAEARGLNPSEGMIDTLARWLLETAAELEENDYDE
jgi:hypothetical protein